MKLIVGLGNPGSEYERTRHNAGFMVVDRLIARHAPQEPLRARFHAGVVEAALPGSKTLLIKPTTYMNRSGQSVAEALRFYKLDPPSDLLVIVDDTSLPVGGTRLRASGSDGGHNGLFDIARALGSEAYPRLRVGVGAPGEVPLRDYVLRRFAPDQTADLDRALESAADAAEVWAREGVVAAMNQFNTKSAGFSPRETPERDESHPGTASNGAA